jgi:hypothetical protein
MLDPGSTNPDPQHYFIPFPGSLLVFISLFHITVSVNYHLFGGLVGLADILHLCDQISSAQQCFLSLHWVILGWSRGGVPGGISNTGFHTAARRTNHLATVRPTLS